MDTTIRRKTLTSMSTVIQCLSQIVNQQPVNLELSFYLLLLCFIRWMTGLSSILYKPIILFNVFHIFYVISLLLSEHKHCLVVDSDIKVRTSNFNNVFKFNFPENISFPLISFKLYSAVEVTKLCSSENIIINKILTQKNKDLPVR